MAVLHPPPPPPPVRVVAEGGISGWQITLIALAAALVAAAVAVLPDRARAARKIYAPNRLNPPPHRAACRPATTGCVARHHN